ncbi:MAG: hypothetical protein KGL39_51160 [Patescibacteria group bacterium]|nr:hypothetical protein [Patescibacteria group bacterium]
MRRLFRKGDKVMVEGVVATDQAERKVRISFGEGVEGHFGWVPASHLTLVTPAPEPIKIGDWVRTDLEYVGIVLGIDGRAAWIRFDDSSHGTVLLTELIRLDHEPQS